MLKRILYITTLMVSSLTLAQGSKYSFNLSELQSKFDLSLSDIYLAQSISFPEKLDWFNGIVGNEKMGQLAISPVGSSLSVMGKGIKIKAFQSVKSLKFEICEDRFNCKAIDVKGAKDSYVFGIPGGSWEIKRSGYPCKDTAECELFIPSWALEIMRLSKGSMQPFPNLMTMVYHRNGLALYNPKLGKLLFNIGNLGQERIKGNLQTVNLTDSVTLIRGETSAFILDWINDRAIKITTDSISKTTNGLLNLANADTLNLANFTPNKKRKLIGVNLGYIVFSDLVVEWSVDESGAIRIGNQSNLPQGSEAISFTSVASVNNVLVKKDKTYTFSTIDKINRWIVRKTFSFNGKGNFEIFGDSLYHFGKDGLKVLIEDKLKYTSLSDSGKSVYMTDSTSAFIQYFTDTKCEWQHFMVHPKHPDSLSSSGVKIPCGQFNGFSTGEKMSTMTSFQGLSVVVEQFQNK